MSLTTYAGLKASVASFLNRTDLTDQIPDFIALAEARMRRDIRGREQVTSQDVTIDDTIYPVPHCFEGLISMTRLSADRTPVTYTPPDQIDRYQSLGYGTRYYISGDTFYFDAAPGEVRMRYRKTFPALSGATRCNWILESHPDAYLYGTLMQTAPYLRDDDRIGVWASLYAKAVDAINKQSIRQETGGPLRIQVSACP